MVEIGEGKRIDLKFGIHLKLDFIFNERKRINRFFEYVKYFNVS